MSRAVSGTTSDSTSKFDFGTYKEDERIRNKFENHKGALTSDFVKDFLDAAQERWVNSEIFACNEAWHIVEFKVRSRVIRAISTGRLDGDEARKCCMYLDRLTRSGAVRWYS